MVGLTTCGLPISYYDGLLTQTRECPADQSCQLRL
jgi:hypothetical protein